MYNVFAGTPLPTYHSAKHIAKLQKKNDQEVLAHIKRYGRIDYDRCSRPWMNAVDRLQALGQIRSNGEGGYVLA